MKYLLFSAIASFILWSSNSQRIPDNSVQHRIVVNDSLQAIWDAHIHEIQSQLADRISLPADSVFSNVQIGMFKNMPAERFLNVMKMGFSRSLGVGCDHCHNTRDWSSDEVVAKQTARDMWHMTHQLNNEMLKEIAGLQDKRVFVNCTTCHRGEVKPATRME